VTYQNKRTAISLFLIGAIATLIWASQLFMGSKSVPHCDINSGRCEVVSNDIEYQFTLGPMPARSLNKMTLTADTELPGVNRVWVDLQGADMYMGVNQFEMKETEGLWQGQTQLAVCTTDTMTWLATVIFETDSEQEIVELRFDAR